MAGGRFEKGVAKVRPGTYTNFDDKDTSLASAGGAGTGGAGGGGGGGKLPDYCIGYIYSLETSCALSHTELDFVAAAEDVYCGTLVFN